MSKVDVVAAQKAMVLAGQDAALESGLGAAYDAGVAEAPIGTGGITQEQMDMAIAAAVAPLNDQVATLQAKIDQIKALLG